jgi:hypothetical protein
MEMVAHKATLVAQAARVLVALREMLADRGVEAPKETPVAVSQQVAGECKAVLSEVLSMVLPLADLWVEGPAIARPNRDNGSSKLLFFYPRFVRSAGFFMGCLRTSRP